MSSLNILDIDFSNNLINNIFSFQKETINITVKISNNETYFIKVLSDETIKSLKNKLKNLNYFKDVEDFKFVYNNIILKDETKTIKYYKISDNSLLNIDFISIKIILLINSRRFTMNVYKHTTIEQLKYRLKHSNLPYDKDFQLYYKGIIMVNSRTIESYNIKNNDEIEYNMDLILLVIDCNFYTKPKNKFILHIKRNENLINIKRLIFEKIHIPIGAQYFIYHCKYLLDDSIIVNDIFPLYDYITFNLNVKPYDQSDYDKLL